MTIDDYLQNATATQREALQRIRDIVKQTVPGAEETNRLRYANHNV